MNDSVMIIFVGRRIMIGVLKIIFIWGRIMIVALL